MQTIVTVRFDPFFSILQVLYDDEHVLAMIIENRSWALNPDIVLITKNQTERIAVYESASDDYIEFGT